MSFSGTVTAISSWTETQNHPDATAVEVGSEELRKVRKNAIEPGSPRDERYTGDDKRRAETSSHGRKVLRPV